MIAHAIALAAASRLFERIVVSTDSSEIQAIAEREGAEVPFVRPAALSDDHTTTASVLAHALEATDAAVRYDYACCLYPATPFAEVGDLRKGLALVSETGAGSSLAVAAFAAPIWRAFELRHDGTLAMLWPEHRDTRSQDLRPAVHDVGQFYWVPVHDFLANPVLYTATSRGVAFERWRAHDIDTLEDWDRAELIYRALKGGRMQ